MRRALALLLLALPAVARGDGPRGGVMAGGTFDFVGPAGGWWAAADAWFGRHGIRADAFGVRSSILVEGSYQLLVGNAWPNLVAAVRVGAGVDARDPAPVVGLGSGLVIALGLPRPLAIAARVDVHVVGRDRPHVFVTLTAGVGAVF